MHLYLARIFNWDNICFFDICIGVFLDLNQKEKTPTKTQFQFEIWSRKLVLQSTPHTFFAWFSFMLRLFIVLIISAIFLSVNINCFYRFELCFHGLYISPTLHSPSTQKMFLIFSFLFLDKPSSFLLTSWNFLYIYIYICVSWRRLIYHSLTDHHRWPWLIKKNEVINSRKK